MSNECRKCEGRFKVYLLWAVQVVVQGPERYSPSLASSNMVAAWGHAGCMGRVYS